VLPRSVRRSVGRCRSFSCFSCLHATDTEEAIRNAIDETLAAKIQFEEALLASAVLHTVSKADPDRNEEGMKRGVASSAASPSTPTAAEVVTTSASSRK
jgi:hypothetical protein